MQRYYIGLLNRQILISKPISEWHTGVHHVYGYRAILYIRYADKHEAFLRKDISVPEYCNLSASSLCHTEDLCDLGKRSGREYDQGSTNYQRR